MIGLNEGKVPLRQYFEMKIDALKEIIDERDRQYLQRLKDLEDSLTVSILARKEAVEAAFIASEKAIAKSEAAQKDHNIHSNEFRGQLNDQAKTLMPRLETVSLLKGMEDRLAFVQQTFETRYETMRSANEKAIATLSSEITSLREFRSQREGSHDQAIDTRIVVLAIIGFVITISLFIVSIVITRIK